MTDSAIGILHLLHTMQGQGRSTRQAVSLTSPRRRITSHGSTAFLAKLRNIKPARIFLVLRITICPLKAKGLLSKYHSLRTVGTKLFRKSAVCSEISLKSTLQSLLLRAVPNTTLKSVAFPLRITSFTKVAATHSISFSTATLRRKSKTESRITSVARGFSRKSCIMT